tara:strand:+ start:561 stop:893 length:333 start_codon:yes stop_codon:yes gene_type:complete
MKKFSTRIFDIEEEARLLILETIPKGETKELISKEDLDDFSDELYDLPFCVNVGKYDTYTQYAIISVKHTEEGGLIFNGYATGEDSGKRRDFDTSDISCGFLAEIADLIK